jgi:hypothetical protein
MLQKTFPPLMPGPAVAVGSSLAELRRIDRAAKFALMGWPRRLANLAARGLWPLVALASILAWQLPRHGARARAASGRSLIAQGFDQLRLALQAGLWPHQYYMFELFRPELRARAPLYLLRHETKHGVFTILKDGPRKNRVFARKDLFAAACGAAGLPHADIIALLAGGVAHWKSAETSLPQRDLFVKPAQARGGRGAARWRWTGAGFESNDGARASPESLLARLCARREPLVVMPCLANHPDLASLALGALSTVRLVTCRDEQGNPELIGAALRFAQRADAIVDNFHAGGLAATIDLAGGVLGPATDQGLARGSGQGWHDRHPVSGAAIAGRVVPFWPETRALAERAHAALGDRVVIGWDIAVLADGPVLIEANSFPDLDILQRCGRAPLGATRLCDLLAWHLRLAYPRWRRHHGLSPD